MAGTLRAVGAALGVAGAVVASAELYVETGLAKYLRRLYVEAVLTDSRYIGGAERLGLKVYALSSDGEWCRENIVLRVIGTRSDRVLTQNAAEFYLKRLSERISSGDFCPRARSAEVYAYAEKNMDPLFRGSSLATVEWNDWQWERL